MAERGELKILENGHSRQHARRLIRANNTEPRDPVGGPAVDPLSLEHDTPLVGLERAGDRAEERRLACTVRADQARDRMVRDLERRAVDRSHTAEGAHDVLDLEQRGHSSTISRLLPSSPWGRSTTSTRMISPMIISLR